MKSKAILLLLSIISVIAIGIMPKQSKAINIDELIVVAAKNDLPGTVPEAQGGQVSLLPEDVEIAEGDTDSGGYFHPFLGVQGEFTDNLYNIYTDEVENFLTTISPGIWFALPRKKVIPIAMASHNTSPGGLQYQLLQQETTDRYLAYLLAKGDFKYYSHSSDLNETNWLGEGLFRYNFPGGLSLQLLDRYSQNRDIFGYHTYATDDPGDYTSNLLMATADWLLTEKLRLKLDYSNFALKYDDAIWDYKDRVDNSFDFYGYFNYSFKTSFFLEYKFVDVVYDEETINDNQQNYYYAGMTWDTTEKLSLLFKAGYQDRTFDNRINEDRTGFAMDFQSLYRFSEKTDTTLRFYLTNEETDIVSASDRDVFGLDFGYNQEFTERLSGHVNFQYENADYNQTGNVAREDQTYFVRPALKYLFREWLSGELAYEYDERDSTIDIYDYKTNTFLLNISFAL